MAVALSVTCNGRWQQASAALTGDTASTVRLFTITYPDGFTQTITAKTNGSGAVTVNFNPWVYGSHTVTVTSTAAPSQIATATAVV